MVALVKERGLEAFRQQFADAPAKLEWLEAHFSRSNSALLKPLLEDVDDSHFSLRHWVDALILMGEWLDARGLMASLEDQIGFVSCANAAAGAGAQVSSLPGIVSEMLESYGFERAVKK
ncbi:MAG: hypothetical protein ACPG3X_06565 [Opitutales bacterium]